MALITIIINIISLVQKLASTRGHLQKYVLPR